jgi:hypothetical protein
VDASNAPIIGGVNEMQVSLKTPLPRGAQLANLSNKYIGIFADAHCTYPTRPAIKGAGLLPV